MNLFLRGTNEWVKIKKNRILRDQINKLFYNDSLREAICELLILIQLINYNSVFVNVRPLLFLARRVI